MTEDLRSMTADTHTTLNIVLRLGNVVDGYKTFASEIFKPRKITLLKQFPE